MSGSRTLPVRFVKEAGRTVLFFGGTLLRRLPRTDDSLRDGLLTEQVVGGSVWIPLSELDADKIGFPLEKPDGIYPATITITEKDST